MYIAGLHVLLVSWPPHQLQELAIQQRETESERQRQRERKTKRERDKDREGDTQIE